MVYTRKKSGDLLQPLGNVRSVFSRHTTDVISLCAFGLEADVMYNRNSEFSANAKAPFTPSMRGRLREVLYSFSPELVHFLRFRVFSQRVTNFFMKLVSDTIEYRKKNRVDRSDFLHLLMTVQTRGKEDAEELGELI